MLSRSRPARLVVSTYATQFDVPRSASASVVGNVVTDAVSIHCRNGGL